MASFIHFNGQDASINLDLVLTINKITSEAGNPSLQFKNLNGRFAEIEFDSEKSRDYCFKEALNHGNGRIIYPDYDESADLV